jgi:hypothetical protein
MKVYNRYCIVNYFHLEATGKFLDCRKCPMDCKCKNVEVSK